jgi:hypothetical protein
MHRIDGADHVSNTFTEGNPGSGIAATQVTAAWLNDVQENVVTPILNTGISLVKGTATQLYAAIMALICRAQTTTATGTQNNFQLLRGRRVFLNCNNASLLTLTGFTFADATAPADGDTVELVAVGAGQVDIENEAAGSTAANRARNGVTGTISLSPGSGRARFVYSGVLSRWVCVHHEQGAWIAVPFNASNFTANASMTWTVQSGDVITFKYRLRGRSLTVAIAVQTTTVAGTPDISLQVAIPGGFVAAADVRNACVVQDDTTRGAGMMFVAPGTGGGAIITFRKMADTAWAPSTNLTQTIGVLEFEVT